MPRGPVKAKITKGFMHLGRMLNPGDEFEGEPDVIAALVRQGYAQELKEPPAAKPEPQPQEVADPPEEQPHYSEPPRPKEPEQRHPKPAASRAGPAKKTHR